MRLAEGTVVGGYQVGPIIGQGGFGITYRAFHQASQTVCALKEYFPSDFAARQHDGSVVARQGCKRHYDEGLKAFIAEANTLKSLPPQEGLVKVMSAFMRLGTAYCAMEFIEGEPISQLAPKVVARNGLVPQNLVIDVATAVARALDAVHRSGLIHRDVKPANIMIRRDNRPVLIDFGAARPTTQTQSGMSMMSREYAPCEQFPKMRKESALRAGEGPWTDLYSLSITLYELLAQKRPPNAEDRFGAVSRGEPDPYEPLSEETTGTVSRYSPGLRAAIDKGCSLLPQERFQNASSLLAVIERSRPVSGPVPSDPTPPSKPNPKPPPGRKPGGGMFALAILVICVCVAGLGILLPYLME